MKDIKKFDVIRKAARTLHQTAGAVERSLFRQESPELAATTKVDGWVKAQLKSTRVGRR